MSEKCDRWEREGLLAAERGEPLDAHFESCPDCLAARAANEAVIARIVQTGQGWQPPGDWEARVMARIAREKPARRFAWWYALFPMVAAAAAAIFLARPAPPGGSAEALTLTLGVVDAQQVVRGENPKPGDALSLQVNAGHVSHVALRVYRDDRTLIYACGDASDCPRQGPNVEARVIMDAPGEYRTAVFGGPAAAPSPAGSLDADVARAREVGLQVVLGEAVRVW